MSTNKFSQIGKCCNALLIMLLICCNAFAQTQQIKGIVKDELGQGLPGASVSVKNSSNGTITNSDGNYSLNVDPASDILLVSFMGYKLQEIPVNNRAIIDISLEPNAKQLNEVVVT